MYRPGDGLFHDRWLVNWHCQSFGLTNCIQALARDVECEACYFLSFAKAIEADAQHWRSWDRIILMREAVDLPSFDGPQMPAFEVLPPLLFSGYHPDCCYVLVDDKPISGGVVGPNHSMIALAAYKEGMDAAKAARWFNAATYAQAGYFAQWP